LEIGSLKQKIVSKIASWGLFWGTIALVVKITLCASAAFTIPNPHQICCSPQYPSKAAATVGQWVERGRYDGWSVESCTVTFHVTEGEWTQFSSGERRDIARYLADEIMPKLPDKIFIIRSDKGCCVANGALHQSQLSEDYCRVASVSVTP
jgi:hypothetical protein